MTAETVQRWFRDTGKTFGINDPLYYEYGVDPEGVAYTRLVSSRGEVYVKPFATAMTDDIKARVIRGDDKLAS